MMQKFIRVVAVLVSIAMFSAISDIGLFNNAGISTALASEEETGLLLDVDCTEKLMFAGWNSGNAGVSKFNNTEGANQLEGSWAMMYTNIPDFQNAETVRVLIKSSSGNDILSHQFSFTTTADGDCSNGFSIIADNYNAYISGSGYKWVNIPIKHSDTTSTEARLWIQAGVYVKQVQVLPKGYVPDEQPTVTELLLDVDCTEKLMFAGWNSGNAGGSKFNNTEGANQLEGSWAMMYANIPDFQNAETVRVLIKSSSGNDIISHQFSFSTTADGDCSNGFSAIADNYNVYISGSEYKWVNVPIKRQDTTSTEGRLWIQAGVYVKQVQVLPKGYVSDDESSDGPLMDVDCSKMLVFSGWNSWNAGGSSLNSEEEANQLAGSWAMFVPNINDFNNVKAVRLLVKSQSGADETVFVTFTSTSDSKCEDGLERIAEQQTIAVSGSEYTWVDVPVMRLSSDYDEGRLWVVANVFVKCVQVMPESYNMETGYNFNKPPVIKYFEDAKKTYKNDTDYTESIVADYTVGAYSSIDKPNPIILQWPSIKNCNDYTLTVTETKTGKSRTFTGITSSFYGVYNLKSDTDYSWQVTGAGETSETYTFHTENTPRLLNIGGVSNVRDIGGWTGLNQGLVFRGGYMDSPSDSSNRISEEGKAEMAELGIKTEIDLRGSSEINQYKSAISDDVRWLNYELQYSGEEAMRRVMLEFTDIDNYPIYMHCVGGADRTGARIFLLEALCGCEETDMSIDYELTSFSNWGVRERNSDTYRGLVSGQAFRGGETLKEQVENYFMDGLGFSRAHVSNIRSILAGNGVVFAQPKDLYFGGTVNVALKNMGDHTVTKVTINGEQIDFTVSENVVSFTPGTLGTGEIMFEDANVLPFDVTNILVSSLPENGGVSINADTDVVLTFTDVPDVDTFTGDTVKINGSSDLLEGFSYDAENAPNSITVNLKHLECGKRYFVELKGVTVGSAANVSECMAFTTPFRKTVSKTDFNGNNLSTYFSWGGNYTNIELADGALHISKDSSLQSFAFLHLGSMTAEDVDFIRLKIRSNGSINPKYYFTTTTQSEYDGNKSEIAETALPASDDYKIVDIRLSDNENWTGTISGSRVDIVGDATEIYIDEISFHSDFKGADDVQTPYLLGEYSLIKNMGAKTEKNITNAGIEHGDISAFLGGFYNNTDKAVDIFLANVMYENGKLIQIACDSAKIGAFDSLQTPLTATLTDAPDYKEGLEIKTFLWDANQSPMTGAVRIGE